MKIRDYVHVALCCLCIFSLLAVEIYSGRAVQADAPTEVSTLRTKLDAKESQIKVLRAQVNVMTNSLNLCMSTMSNLAMQDPVPATLPATAEPTEDKSK